MSKIVVDLDNEEQEELESGTPEFGDYQKPKKRGFFTKVLITMSVMILVVTLVGSVSGYLYWRHLKTTPQYSLALIVDAARRDDQNAIDDLIDTEAVVQDFVPQVVDKAVDLYGRGVSPTILKRVARVAAPVFSVVRQRAKAELPEIIREKTKRFEKIPFWAIAMGADRYLDIRLEGEKAFIKSKDSERKIEVEMKRVTDKWRIVAFKDEELAQKIAGKIGQEIIALAKNSGKETIENLGKRIGIKNLGDLFEKAQDAIKK